MTRARRWELMHGDKVNTHWINTNKAGVAAGFGANGLLTVCFEMWRQCGAVVGTGCGTIGWR